jgi:hypothetical protein
MSNEQLAVVCGGFTVARTGPRASANAPAEGGDDVTPPDSLAVLAEAASLRLDDPRAEQERIVLVSAALVAGREVARALDAWLLQSLTEYRGSPSAWDLETTSAHLRIALARYEQTLEETSEWLSRLIPTLATASHQRRPTD